MKEEENENEQIKNNKFLLVEYRYDGISKKQKVNVIMQKIRICFSMSTMARLYQFYSHYYGMYSQSCENITLVMAEMDERYKKDKLKNILQFKYGQKNSSSEISDTSSYISGSEVTEEDEEITKMIKEEIDKKKLFGKDFANVLNKDLKEMKTLKENNINTNSINNNDDIGLKPSQTNIYFNEIAEESMKNKKDKLSKILKETKEKSEIDVKFEMKESLLEFPLDDTKSKTKVLRFQHNFICTMTMDSEYYMTVDGNGKLIETKYITNNKKLCAKLLNISFSIANFTNGIYSIDNICDQMLQGFRFSTNLNQFLLLPYKERSVMLIDVIFEPLVFNIGFRQTKALMKFLPKISEFLTDMYKEYDDPLKEVDINKYEKMSEFLSGNEKGNVIHESEEKILADVSEEELEKKEAKKKKKIQKYKILQKQKEVRNFIQQKKKELVEQKLKQVQAKTNIDDINYMMSVKVIIDKTSFKFMDDTGEYLIPLLSIDITQVLVRYIQNSNTDSVENVSNLILESISRKSIPLEEYDINGLSMYVEMGFNTDIHFYNDRINNWEPIIERYSGLLKIDQVTSFSRMRILFKSDDIFNLNVSISSMNVLNKVIKKFGENEEMWDIDKPEENNDVTKNVSDKVAIEFLNISGVDIDCWLDAQEIINTDNNNQLYKFTLDSNNKNCKKIRRNFLSKIYQRLSETQLKMKKDKFSFKIKGYVTIYGNDLSSNYTSSFRMKSKKFANERVGSVYEKIKPKQRTKSDNKNINDANNLTIQSLEMRTNSVILEGLLDDDTESLKEQENNQNKNINDEIEILVKVRQNGTMKSIVFESNIFIFNNLQVPISLSLISQSDFTNLYKSDEKNKNHFDNKNKIVINTGVRKSIPLSYIINKYRIYISFYNKENEKDNNYYLLY